MERFGQQSIAARVLGLFAGMAALMSPAYAWDAHGHRTITQLAIDEYQQRLPEADRSTLLAFALSESGRNQIGYQSGEPDRYRAIRLGALKHENDPEHYVDVEDLEPFGLTLATVPQLRVEYIRVMAIAMHEHPEQMRPYNPKTDTAMTGMFPGFLLHAIIEHYGKLISSYRQVRVLERLSDPARADQLAAARSNVLYEMGYLSHLVGDAAQPLHTTRHHHGWVDENPTGYTTNRGFHAYIDTTILGVHKLSYDTLKVPVAELKIAHEIDANDPWPAILQHVQRSFDEVRPLYELEKSGELQKDAGKAFITKRLGDGAAMLSALYLSAWKASAMTEQDAKDFVRYDQVSPVEPNPMLPSPRSAAGGDSSKPPASKPQATPPASPTP